MPTATRLRGTVLIADEDPETRKVACGRLAGAGFTTRPAVTGDEAIAAAARDRPDLVVLEVWLPGLSGYEVCRKLRTQFGRQLPIMFVSATRTEASDRVVGLLIGADDYLIKPFAPEELVARVEALLRRSDGVVNGIRLTSREREVLELLAAGLRRQDIAEMLVISPKTVGTHVEHILAKLGVHSQAQAIAESYRTGLLERL